MSLGLGLKLIDFKTRQLVDYDRQFALRLYAKAAIAGDSEATYCLTYILSNESLAITYCVDPSKIKSIQQLMLREDRASITKLASVAKGK